VNSIKGQYKNLFPRFLVAVTSMAAGTGSLRERLAWVVIDVTVFAESQIPRGVARRYREFHKLVFSAKVPAGYEGHPDRVKAIRAFHLSPQKAKRAVALLTGMFETIAYRKDWDEAELAAQESAEDDEDLGT